ncbi:unnamed protein product [Rotaria sordida]|uniref:TRPM-like domain-containing protein n=1 Tax=Rotaria sordida TaxID=392033 RepID=A0A813UKP2_9BILA|nr:unnamed protein product [Rotaria sordida]
MLRELFLWSVYAGYSDIAFIPLLQLESRISAALIAACIARRLSLFAINLDLRRTFDQQTKDYEEYASACVTACYKHNERLACQLLVRENLLFGDVTCMQIAIASRNIPFINTDCFNTVLTKGWVDQLACNITEPSNSTVNFLVSLLTLGLAAPYLMKYREADTDNGTNQDHSEKNDVTNQRYRRWKGIEDEIVEFPNYWQKLLYFHSAPIVKINYDFAIYVWFLLVFSYVVLFNMKRDENLFCWTKIYLIITVSAMLLEDFRQFLADLYTQMVEKQDKSRSWIASFRAMIYILFYIGIIFHFKSTNRPGLFKVARIILAIDLELWFLFSLRFVSAIRLLGPKLFMIQNMVRDLLAFIYIIFSILMVVFYQPYWFLHSIVDDEKKTLDGIFSNAATVEDVSAAVVNYILLIFHMLIINILILNLLIAVFNFSINDVQEKNEFFWRYQRYKLICEYFQKPLFAYPPLSLLAYIGWLINVFVFHGATFRIFKYLRSHPKMENNWTEFENAATYEYARHFVEEHYRFKDKITFSTLQEQIDSLKDENEQIRGHLASLN